MPGCCSWYRRPPRASGHQASSWGWDILPSIRVRRAPCFVLRKEGCWTAQQWPEWVEKWKCHSAGLLTLGWWCQFGRRICQDAESAFPSHPFPLLWALVHHPEWYCSSWSILPETDPDVSQKEHTPPSAPRKMILASCSGTSRRPKPVAKTETRHRRNTLEGGKRGFRKRT